MKSKTIGAIVALFLLSLGGGCTALNRPLAGNSEVTELKPAMGDDRFLYYDYKVTWGYDSSIDGDEEEVRMEWLDKKLRQNNLMGHKYEIISREYTVNGRSLVFGDSYIFFYKIKVSR